MSVEIFFLGFAIIFLALVLLGIRPIRIEIDFGSKTTATDPESETPSDKEAD